MPGCYHKTYPRPHCITVKTVPIPAVLLWHLSTSPRDYHGIRVIPLSPSTSSSLVYSNTIPVACWIGFSSITVQFIYFLQAPVLPCNLCRRHNKIKKNLVEQVLHERFHWELGTYSLSKSNKFLLAQVQFTQLRTNSNGSVLRQR